MLMQRIYCKYHATGEVLLLEEKIDQVSKNTDEGLKRITTNGITIKEIVHFFGIPQF
jgi:hypothetical protein